MGQSVGHPCTFLRFLLVQTANDIHFHELKRVHGVSRPVLPGANPF